MTLASLSLASDAIGSSAGWSSTASMEMGSIALRRHHSTGSVHRSVRSGTPPRSRTINSSTLT